MSLILTLLSRWKENLFVILIGLCSFLIFLIGVKNHQINILNMKYYQLKSNIQLQNEAIEQWHLQYNEQQKVIDKAYAKIKENEKKYYADEQALYDQKYSEDCAHATYQAMLAGQKMGKEWNQGD